jgi:hypothetical protein
MADILKNVEISDLIVVNVFKGKPMPGDPNPLMVTVDPIDSTKKVQFDSSALTVLNARLTEKVRGSDVTNPNTIQYIKEFATKMAAEFYRNGLLEIVDIPEAKDDPYEEAKKLFRRK